MATATENKGEQEERRRIKWARKHIPEKIRNYFSEDKKYRQAYFVIGLRFSSLTTEYVFAILITFLTEVWKLKLVMTAVLITNLQEGITSILEIVIAYLVDAYLGYFWMLFLATIGYCIGLGLLSHSYPNFTQEEIDACINNNECASKPLTLSFFVALILITIGKSGTQFSLENFYPGKKEENPREESANNEKSQKRFACISWMLSLVVGSLIGSFGLYYIPLSWKSELQICAYMMAASFFMYWLGTFFYAPDRATGSPLSCVPRVLIAAMKKRYHTCDNTTMFYNEDANDADQQTHACQPSNVGWLRFLNKAAIIESSTSNLRLEVKTWRLCTVQELEDAKRLLRMVPLSMTFLMYGVVRSIGNTFFLEQASDMDPRLGSIKEFPLAALLLLAKAVGYVANKAYDLLMKKGKLDTNKRVSDAIKIFLGLGMSIGCCIVAWRVEHRRLRIINDILDREGDYDIVPMSLFWLVPQFVFLGAMDGLTQNGVASFLSHQVPFSMRRYGAALAECITGTGTILSLAMILIIHDATENGDDSGWFAEKVDESHLDSFYKVLSIVSSINICFYVLVVMKYSYKQSEQQGDGDEEQV